MNGNFAKTADVELLEIPVADISKLPDPEVEPEEEKEAGVSADTIAKALLDIAPVAGGNLRTEIIEDEFTVMHP